MMLPGIIIKPLKRFADERGFFTEIMRKDWEDIFQDEIVQANLSITYPGIVRAWHRHERGQVDYFVCIKGAIKICAYDDKTQELAEIISTGENPQVVRIPGHYWHGFKVVGNEPAMLVYFVYENPDEIRRPWNDPTIVSEVINGRTDDPRCGKSWDWFYPPHRLSTMNTVQRIAKNTIVLLVSDVISKILGFFYVMDTARYLGAEGFGILSFALAFTGIFGI